MEYLKPVSVTEHSFERVSDEPNPDQSYDVKCTLCGLTGKRWWSAPNVMCTEVRACTGEEEREDEVTIYLPIF